MKSAKGWAVMILVIAGLSAAQAAPNIPSSAMPGRERQRFQETPLDRFTDPTVRPRDGEPLWQWQCHQRSTSRHYKSKSQQGC